MSSRQAHNVHARVLVAEDYMAVANRIGEGLCDAGSALDMVYDRAARRHARTPDPWRPSKVGANGPAMAEKISTDRALYAARRVRSR
jgi:hypothetical protein